jgi:hypothetical protein
MVYNFKINQLKKDLMKSFVSSQKAIETTNAPTNIPNNTAIIIPIIYHNHNYCQVSYPHI